MPYRLVLQYLVKIFYIHTKCERYSCMSDTPPTYLYINVIAITRNHNTLLMPVLIEYFEWVSSLHKYDSDHRQVLACGNVTNAYKRLRILKKFLRSYVYKRRGTPMLCPKSPHRLCRCRCRQAVEAVEAVTAVNAVNAVMPLNVNIQN